MKGVGVLVLLAMLSASGAMPVNAQQMSVAQHQRKSAKDARKQRKAMKKNAKLQRKAQKRTAKAQKKSLKADRKADAKANRKIHQGL
jgi:hypothetical protein